MALKDRIWTIPNALSVLRFFLIIPILIALGKGRPWLALFFMAVGLATDSIDGYIARRFDQCSDLGRLLDPVIDKLAVLSVVLFLIVHPAYDFPLWYFIFLMVREWIVLTGGLLILRGRQIVMESNRAGKNSAFANGIAVVFHVLGFQPYGRIVLWIAFILTLYSTWSYGKQFLSKRKEIGSRHPEPEGE